MRIILVEDHDDLRDTTVEALADGALLDAEFPEFRPTSGIMFIRGAC